uniref:Uncharacterized protein n=1 Tax=Rhizophora mucronata TaxID=61149 RepID=A0A2P2NI72_RHIMU
MTKREDLKIIEARAFDVNVRKDCGPIYGSCIKHAYQSTYVSMIHVWCTLEVKVYF